MLTTNLIRATQPESRRLMVVLHGLGDSMEGYRWLPHAFQLPWLNYLLVNAPDGYYSGYSWYDFAENPSPGIHRSRALLFQLLDEMNQKGFSTRETLMFGFSQGCLMTLEVGLRYPHRFAGLVGISGYAHEPEKLIAEFSPVACEQRFLITHGVNDGLIPFSSVKKQVDLLKQSGVQIDWKAYNKAHTITEDELGDIRKFVVDCFEP